LIEEKADANRGHLPVRLPCGHMFSETCIAKWLGGDTRTCPSCRANFRLARADAADWEATSARLLASMFANREFPTPWWVTMLKNE
jgi:hypothetical protein